MEVSYQPSAESLKNKDEVLPNLYHSIGYGYYRIKKDYNKAIKYLTKSIAYYKTLINKIGMNALESVYFAYHTLSDSYFEIRKYSEASQMLSECAEICRESILLNKLEFTLHKLSYLYCLLREYSKSQETLSEYFGVVSSISIVDSDVRSALGMYALSNWYTNNYKMALICMGEYIIKSIDEEKHPLIIMLEGKDLKEKMEPHIYFEKGFHLFIIPEELSFSEINIMINDICNEIPVLAAPLSGFIRMKKTE